MKKFILALTVIGFASLSSCKKEADKVEDSTEQTLKDLHNEAEVGQEANANLESASNIAADIPQFSNGELQAFAQDYAAYFQSLVDASNKGDSEKLQQLTGEGMDWSKKAAEMTQKMTEEDAEKWKQWEARLRASVSAE